MRDLCNQLSVEHLNANIICDVHLQVLVACNFCHTTLVPLGNKLGWRKVVQRCVAMTVAVTSRPILPRYVAEVSVLPLHGKVKRSSSDQT